MARGARRELEAIVSPQSRQLRRSETSSQKLDDLGRRIRRGRQRRGLSVSELAAELGVSAPYVSVLERGERRPLLPVLLRTAAVLDLPIRTLLRLAGHATDPVSLPPTTLVELATGVRGITDKDVLAIKASLTALQRKSGSDPASRGDT